MWSPRNWCQTLWYADSRQIGQIRSRFSKRRSRSLAEPWLTSIAFQPVTFENLPRSTMPSFRCPAVWEKRSRASRRPRTFRQQNRQKMEIADSKGNGPRSAPARRWWLSSRAEEAKLIGGMTFGRVFHERVGLAGHHVGPCCQRWQRREPMPAPYSRVPLHCSAWLICVPIREFDRAALHAYAITLSARTRPLPHFHSGPTPQIEGESALGVPTAHGYTDGCQEGCVTGLPQTNSKLNSFHVSGLACHAFTYSNSSIRCQCSA